VGASFNARQSIANADARIVASCLVSWKLPPHAANRDASSMKTTPLQPPLEEKTTISDSAAASQAQDARGRIHLIIGPVGAGKSTFAQELAREHRAARLTLDEWMAALFSPDRPSEGIMQWYVERTARCIEQIWTTARGVLEVHTDVVLEIGLIRRGEREKFYERVAEAGFGMSIYVLDAARDVRRERVEHRNQSRGVTFSMVVLPAIFELASNLWEPPGPLECEGRDVRFIRTD
jgi:predicted kinase